MPYFQELGRDAPDYQYVKKVTERILEENFVLEPPVLPRELAGNDGYKVLFAEFPQKFSHVMGFCKFDTGEIYVNAADPANRQTFTIAHEFGHLKMHSAFLKDNPNRYQVLLRGPMGSQKDPLEQEANAFAANLLVPRKMLEKFYKIGGVRELSKLFIVSEEVIRWRLINEKLSQE